MQLSVDLTLFKMLSGNEEQGHACLDFKQHVAV